MAMERDNKGPRTRKRRKVCQFCADKCEWIDYKDDLSCIVIFPSVARFCPAVPPVLAQCISVS